MLEELKQKVFKANLDLVKQGLVIFTCGLPQEHFSLFRIQISLVLYLRSGKPSLSRDVNTSSPFSPIGRGSSVSGSMISA